MKVGKKGGEKILRSKKNKTKQGRGGREAGEREIQNEDAQMR